MLNSDSYCGCKEYYIKDDYRQLAIFNFDDQLNTTSIAYVKTGNIDKDEFMAQDTDNDGILVAYIDSRKRLLMKFLSRFYPGYSKTFITSNCFVKQTIVSLAFDDKTK